MTIIQKFRTMLTQCFIQSTVHVHMAHYKKLNLIIKTSRLYCCIHRWPFYRWVTQLLVQLLLGWPFLLVTAPVKYKSVNQELCPTMWLYTPCISCSLSPVIEPTMESFFPRTWSVMPLTYPLVCAALYLALPAECSGLLPISGAGHAANSLNSCAFGGMKISGEFAENMD